jgi:hypothetical protein
MLQYVFVNTARRRASDHLSKYLFHPFVYEEKREIVFLNTQRSFNVNASGSVTLIDKSREITQ